MLKLTVLGRYGGVPARNGALSSYLVQSKEAKILLDCGSGALSRLQNYCKIEELDAIVLSHLHADHISDMYPLRYYLQNTDKKIPVYMPLVKEHEYELLVQCDNFVLNPIIEGINAKIKDVALKFYKMYHKVETYATRLESDGRVLVYSGDTEFNPNISRSLKGAHTFLADCSIPTVLHGEEYSHMSVSEGVSLAKDAGARLIITHILNDMSPKLEARILYNNAVVADEGKTYKI